MDRIFTRAGLRRSRQRFRARAITSPRCSAPSPSSCPRQDGGVSVLVTAACIAGRCCARRVAAPPARRCPYHGGRTTSTARCRVRTGRLRGVRQERAGLRTPRAWRATAASSSRASAHRALAGRAPRPRHAIDRPAPAICLPRRRSSCRGLGQAPLRRQLEGAARETTATATTSASSTSRSQDRAAVAVPARVGEEKAIKAVVRDWGNATSRSTGRRATSGRSSGSATRRARVEPFVAALEPATAPRSRAAAS